MNVTSATVQSSRDAMSGERPVLVGIDGPADARRAMCLAGEYARGVAARVSSSSTPSG